MKKYTLTEEKKEWAGKFCLGLKQTFLLVKKGDYWPAIAFAKAWLKLK